MNSSEDDFGPLFGPSESKKISLSEVRNMILSEAEALSEAGIAGLSSHIRSRTPRTRRTSRVEDTPEMVQPTHSPAVGQAKKLISDWLFLYGTFTPKFRRSMCLGRAGDKLAFALQNLDDMLAKL